MKKLRLEKIREFYGLRLFGQKGWLYNPHFNCVSCGKHGKFGFKISKKGGVVHCFKCEFKTSIFKFLKEQGKEDFIIYDRERSLKEKLPNINTETQVERKELKEVDLPLGFKRLKQDDYLDSRGFQPWQYKQFKVGETDSILEEKLNDGLIFQIFQKGKRVAWLFRSRKDKDWHEENIQRAKLGNEKLVLRYRNSDDTDFDGILGGVDEIKKKTKRLILVEGLFDKANVDKLLKLNERKDMKCCFTFGNKVSDEQIRLIEETNVEEIILMYDPGTIKQIKTYSSRLSKKFKVWVAEIKGDDIDPGNISLKYLEEIMNNLVDFLYFYKNRIDLKFK